MDIMIGCYTTSLISRLLLYLMSFVCLLCLANMIDPIHRRSLMFIVCSLCLIYCIY